MRFALGIAFALPRTAPTADAKSLGNIDVARLSADIESNGLVGALADLSAAHDLRVSDMLTLDLGPGSPFGAGQLFERKQCTLPPERVQSCSCFEIFNMADLWLKHSRVDEEEYKQRFKRAVKFYHPDKRGGSHDHMMHLKHCSALLRDPSLKKVRKEYIVELKKTLEKCKKHGRRMFSSHGECYRSEVEMLHDCEMGICLSEPKAFHSNSAVEYTENGIIERLVVLLDDSFSMDGWKLHSAKKALASIMPRIERTPTDVHFIRSKAGMEGFVSTQVFAHNETSIGFEDIARQWKVCCRTFLWEYAYHIVADIVTPHIEVVIITDGDDNDSAEHFNGAEGFSHMMDLLLRTGKQPRFRVFCIGRDPCTGRRNTPYRDLALATGGTFAAVVRDTDTDAESAVLKTFAKETNAPFDERKERATDAQDRYKRLLLEGNAKRYDWADAIMPKERKKTQEL